MAIVATEEQIKDRINEMASKILASNYKNLIFVALLNGAAPFTTELMWAMQRQDPDNYPAAYYIFASTYENGTTSKETRLNCDTLDKLSLGSHTIIVLDDVLDSGKTFAAVRTNLVGRGAHQDAVKLAVLTQKDVERPASASADYVGFYFGNDWLYGFGLDTIPGVNVPEAGRWLTDIHTADQRLA